MDFEKQQLNIPQLKVVIDNQIKDYEDFISKPIRVVGLREKVEKRIKTLNDCLIILNEHKE